MNKCNKCGLYDSQTCSQSDCGRHRVQTAVMDQRCSECGEWVLLGHAVKCSFHPLNILQLHVGGLVRTTVFEPGVTMRDGDTLTHITKVSQDALREVRLWHWNKAVAYRNSAVFLAECENHPESVLMNKAANFHIKAVQALNDCFEINDTAEQDAAK